MKLNQKYFLLTYITIVLMLITSTALAVSPDIKANDSDGPVTTLKRDLLRATVSLDPDSQFGVECDWWVAAETPFGWFYFDVGIMNWTYAGTSYTGLSPTHQGPLFDLTPPFGVLNMSVPEGTYTFYFAVDTTMNGLLDFDSLYYDSVIVNVISTDIKQPTVSITSPVNGAKVSGTVSVSAIASDNVAVDWVEFYVDGLFVSKVTTAPYGFNLNISSMTDGNHTIKATAYDTSTNSASDTVTVEVDKGPKGTGIDKDGDGFTTDEGDCDDNDASVFPGAPELCDGRDNDCDGVAEEGLTFDEDGDGFTTPDSCSGTKDDCDDTDPSINTGAVEIPNNGIDEDCDGSDLVINPLPTVNISASSQDIIVGGSTSLYWDATSADSCFIEPDVGVVGISGNITVNPVVTTTYTITAFGTNGNASDQTMIKVLGDVEPQPEGSFGEQYADLVPQDATVESYDPKRFSLVTGLVGDMTGNPIAGVTVCIHHRMQYGTATTDATGRFSIPTDGGDTITLTYDKAGLVATSRQVYVSWNGTAIAETVVMIAEDIASTTLTFDGDPTTVVTHRSTDVTDVSGSRSCTTVITGDNMAYLVDENGNDVQQLTTITTRATEYTTSESMPAALPPTSAFTYCVELAVDGVKRVRFDKPVVNWVDNFLGFDVGIIVPVGYFDRDRGVWVASDNGDVVRLLDTDGDGIVDALDADGDNLPDDLNSDGSFTDEVTGLSDSQTYTAGATFWRFEVSHFSPWDCNWSFGLPENWIFPNPTQLPNNDNKKPNSHLNRGRTCMNSFVEDRSRIFNEDIPIPGTDLAFHYSSNRVDGYRTIITIPASGNSIPASVVNIKVSLNIAGKVFEEILPAEPNQVATFSWDGLDFEGNKSLTNTAFVTVSFGYFPVYGGTQRASTSSNRRLFGRRPRARINVRGVSLRDPKPIYIGSSNLINVFSQNNILQNQSFPQGWSLTNHHNLFPGDITTLYKGDGTIVKGNSGIINTVAGGGTAGYPDFGEGGPATDAQIRNMREVEVDAAGNIYFAEIGLVRKVDTNGIITTVAGNGNQQNYSGDGGPATDAEIAAVDVAVDTEGNLYIADWTNNRVRKVDTNGIITTVAGNGSPGYSGDDGPAVNASINWPSSVAVDTVGNLYIAGRFNNRVRKVDTNGIISTVAGNGVYGFSGDDGPATNASFIEINDIAVDSSGNIYIAGWRRVRMVDTSGIITTVAGNGGSYYDGDGGLAIDARIGIVHAITLDASSNIYIATRVSNRYRVRKVNASGVISTVAGNGNGSPPSSGDGGPATDALLTLIAGVAVDAVGSIYIAGWTDNTIRKVEYIKFAYDSPGDISFIEESGIAHIVSKAGRHERTIDVDTGVVLRTFGYDLNNNLVSITDQFGNQTTIERDSNDIPTAIVSPEGLRTVLTTDANNNLTHITHPDNNFYNFEYTPGGLMTAEIEPEGNRFDHTFDSNGRLTDVFDGEGGHWNYTRTVVNGGDFETRVQTAEGDIRTYLDSTDTTGAGTSTITDPTGADTILTESADGFNVNQTLPCGMVIDTKYDNDKEYQFKYEKEVKESVPSGLERVTTRENTYEDTNTDEIFDLITQQVDVNGKVINIENNTILSKRTITTPEGRTIFSMYDPDTLLTTSTTVPGLFDTTFGYDAKGRLTSMSTNTRDTSFTYDAQGFLESATDPVGNTTTYTYDSVGRIKTVDQPDSNSLGFTYDNNGNMTVLTTPSAINHGFGYNQVNQQESYDTPISGSYQYVYDKDRRLTQVMYPSGMQVNNVYTNGRLDQIQTPEGNIDYTYLCSAKIDAITRGAEAATYGYDGPLITSETMGGTLNQALTYTYDNDFNTTSFTYAGSTENYSYDNDGLLTGAGAYTITHNVDNGLPEEVTDSTLILSRVFSGYGEIQDQDSTIGVDSLASWNLTRDDNGRITQKIETVNGTASTYDYTYDNMGRLRTVTKNNTPVEEYRYDANGTRNFETNTLRGIIARAFTYSDEDHLLTAGTTTYLYDVDGFLTTKTDGTDVTQYDYSSQGELLNVALPDGTVVSHVHDPLGRRLSKSVNGTTQEKYLWGGLTTLLAVYDGSDNLLMRFEYADGRMPVAMEKNGSKYYLSYDQVGSLILVTDSSGNVVKQIEYDTFGNIISDTDPSFDVPLGFAGGLHDRNTELVRFGARDYDPEVGRWTAKDPIGFDGGDPNLYGYVGNDPVNLVDPNGECGMPGYVIIKNKFTGGREYEIRVYQKFSRIYEKSKTDPGYTYNLIGTIGTHGKTKKRVNELTDEIINSSFEESKSGLLQILKGQLRKLFKQRDVPYTPLLDALGKPILPYNGYGIRA